MSFSKRISITTQSWFWVEGDYKMEEKEEEEEEEEGEKEEEEGGKIESPYNEIELLKIIPGVEIEGGTTLTRWQELHETKGIYIRPLYELKGNHFGHSRINSNERYVLEFNLAIKKYSKFIYSENMDIQVIIFNDVIANLPRKKIYELKEKIERHRFGKKIKKVFRGEKDDETLEDQEPTQDYKSREIEEINVLVIKNELVAYFSPYMDHNEQEIYASSEMKERIYTKLSEIKIDRVKTDEYHKLLKIIDKFKYDNNSKVEFLDQLHNKILNTMSKYRIFDFSRIIYNWTENKLEKFYYTKVPESHKEIRNGTYIFYAKQKLRSMVYALYIPMSVDYVINNISKKSYIDLNEFIKDTEGLVIIPKIDTAYYIHDFIPNSTIILSKNDKYFFPFNEKVVKKDTSVIKNKFKRSFEKFLGNPDYIWLIGNRKIFWKDRLSNREKMLDDRYFPTFRLKIVLKINFYIKKNVD